MLDQTNQTSASRIDGNALQGVNMSNAFETWPEGGSQIVPAEEKPAVDELAVNEHEPSTQ